MRPVLAVLFSENDAETPVGKPSVDIPECLKTPGEFRHSRKWLSIWLSPDLGIVIRMFPLNDAFEFVGLVPDIGLVPRAGIEPATP